MSEVARRELGGAASAAGKIGGEVIGVLAESLQRPEFRAGLAASMLTTVVLARRLPFWMVLPISLMTGSAVEDLYAMAADVHAKLNADAASED